jgi:tetratricopeptide (TPR) repeat protein
MVRASLAALCATLAAALSTVASAQTPPPSNFAYYNPPKLVKKGTPTSPIGGQGTVVVKVLVYKDGTFKVQGVIHSTNAADDKAALEIAGSSTYTPATRGKVKETSFYDFTLKFAGNGTSSTGEDLPELEQYRRMIDAGNAAGAKADLEKYLAQHAEDQKAELYLGLAETVLKAPKDAVAAFDKAGSIPAEYRVGAAVAYADAAIDAAGAKDSASATALAQKAVELSGTYDKYLVLGYVELAAGELEPATAALEKARDLAKSSNASAKQLSPIYSNLVQAYARSGDFVKAKAAAGESMQLDPESKADQILEQSFISRGNALQNAGKLSDAGALFEQAATALPKAAGAFYARAALAFLAVKPDPANAGKTDPSLVKADADADKALAADPNNPAANYAKGIAVIDLDKSKGKDALEYLKKADELSKKGSDSGLTAAIESAIKQLNGGK